MTRVTFETSFVEETETGTETSFGTLRLGCFALILKQGVSVLRNNRNKQKTKRNKSKFVLIQTFFIPHTISFVCFGRFDTSPKHRNKPKRILWRPHTPKNTETD